MTAKDYLGADYINSYVSGVDPDYTVLFVDQTTSDLTVGKLVARLLKNSLTEKETKTFWVDLKNEDNYCYEPCPSIGNCCSTTSLTDYEGSSIKKYSWLTWVDMCNEFSVRYHASCYSNEFSLVQNYTEPIENLDCGALEITDKTTLDFWRENCKAKHRPLCMRGSADITDKARNIKKEMRDLKKEMGNTKKIFTKTGKGSSWREGRQLTDTGMPIEMCATVLPAVMGN